MATFETLVATLSSNPNLRGREFEDLCRWMLRHAPLYKPLVSRVWRWDEWPGRWGADCGIDLVVQAHSGELWAVQAKAYDAERFLRKADLDSFLSESARPTFAYRLLIATTDLIGSRALSALDGQTVPVGRVMLADLLEMVVSWPEDVRDLSGEPPQQRITPRDASLRAIDSVCSGLQQHERGQLLMACGTGKTLVGLWVAERNEANSVLVLVPSLSLISQTMSEWTANWNTPREVLVVCSDETVTSDREPVHTGDLGIPVTTDATTVASFLAKTTTSVIFSTYHSAPTLVAACEAEGHSFDLIIADEAHRCAGPASGLFGLATDREALPSRHRLFMTATPRIYTARLRTEAADADLDVLSMDDVERFGPVLHRLSFDEAVREKLLTDYEVVITGVGDADVQAAIARRALVLPEGDDGKATDARSLAALAAIVRACERYTLRRLVTFHSRVKAARSFSQRLPVVAAWLDSSLGITADYVSGEMPTGRRRTRLRRLAEGSVSEPSVLANARCLTEGVNVPNLDAVAFIDPRESQTDIVQAVGRVMRRSDDKTLGRVIIPVFLPDDGASPAMDSTEFATVWRVIRALRSHDDSLAEELDAIRRELGRLGPSAARMPSRIVFDMPITCTPEFFDSITLRVVNATTESWEHWFGLLERYVEREGHADVPSEATEDSLPLGNWVTRQRGSYNRQQLSGDRRARLESLPGWTWDAIESRWQENYQALVRYSEREGQATPPILYCEGSLRLGAWAGAQRKIRTSGGLAAHRAALLEQLPGWTWNVIADRFHEGFAALLAYQEEHGNVAVPQKLVFREFGLGQWVARRRKEYRLGRLDDDTVRTLEAVDGWSWSAKGGVSAPVAAALESFVAREGHSKVPYGHHEGGVALGLWLSAVRSRYAKRVLSAAVIDHLEALPGWTWTQKPWSTAEGRMAGQTQATEAWREKRDALLKFALREGHANPRYKHVEDGIKIGTWVVTQRGQHGRDLLSEEAMRLLQEVPGWSWDPREEAWQAQWHELQRFEETFGHCRPEVAPENETLRQWIRDQRRYYRAGRMTPERQARLDSIPTWTWEYFRARLPK